MQRRLGAGAFGVVYAAYDREQDAMVAVKVLAEAEAEALYRLKRDFRSLADLSHPNLLCPHELLVQGEVWLLISELVEGCDLLKWVRPAEECDLARLLGAGGQLASALHYLHSQGVLHRDLKPSNVLVTREGGIRLLDFGLVEMASDWAGREPRPLDPGWGAPAYAPPEVDAEPGGYTVGPAADWYGFGVLLFEALTGKRPFAGGRHPSRTGAAVPEPLDRLVAALLEPCPLARPTGIEILQRLGAQPDPRLVHAAPPTLFGRERELEILRSTYDRTLGGEQTSVWVEGSSGTGKTALVRHFLRELRDRAEPPAILAGRCHRHEAVPFKTFDSLVDALSRYLVSLPAEELAGLRVPGLEALLRLFPVLRRVPGWRDGEPAREPVFLDPQERRRQAFQALRELLAELARRTPVVLVLDDLHWGDRDSAPLFFELMRASAAPLMLVVCLRPDAARQSDLFRALKELPGVLHADKSHERIRLRELSPEATRQLGRSLLPDQDDLVERIVSESGGNPLFVEALARRAGAHENRTTGRRELALDEVLREEVAALGPAARRLLEVLAVAGRPLDQPLAFRAAGLDGAERRSVRGLELAQLIQVRPAAGGPQLEVQDRLREAVLGDLSAAAVEARHGDLAAAMEATGDADPGTLALYYHGSQEPARAAAFARAGAAAACEQYAFARAARLFELALELEPDATEAPELRRRLGDALRLGGRGVEAAEAYLAAVQSGAQDVVELQRLAAEQLLLSGHRDRGLKVLRHVLRTIDTDLPRSQRRLPLDFWYRRLAVRCCPVAFRRRSESEVAPEELRRIDTVWSAAIGLTGIDPVRAGEFHARHYVLALRAGEPDRVVRALALEAAYAVTSGARRRGERHLELARRLAEELSDPHALGRVAVVSTLHATGLGQWSRAAALADQAERLLRERCTGVSWELAIAQNFALQALSSMGAGEEFRARLPGLLVAAKDRGDLYAENILRKWNSRAFLFADDPAAAAGELEQAEARWPRNARFDKPFNALLVAGDIGLYQGRAAVYEELLSSWPEVRASGVLKFEFLRVRLLDLRARSALLAAALASPGSSRPLLRQAARDTRRLRAVGLPWADALASVLRAALAARGGDDAEGCRLYQEAVAKCGECEMRLHAAAARFRLGELLGGEAGEQERQRAITQMRGECGVAAPERWVDLLAPEARRDRG